MDDGNIDTDCYIDEDGSKDDFGDDQYAQEPDGDDYEDVDLDKEEDTSHSNSMFDKSLIASRMLNDPKGNFFIYFYFKFCKLIKSLDIRTSSSSGIDFAIASTPTNQCISSESSLTSAGNISFSQ